MIEKQCSKKQPKNSKKKLLETTWKRPSDHEVPCLPKPIIGENIKDPSKQSRNLSNHDFQEKSKNRPEQSKKLSKNNQNFPKTIPKQSKNHQKPLKMIKNIEFHLQIYI